MLDRYLWGKVDRISPEAPVPVVDVYDEVNRLGGAANVALNIHKLGATPILLGVVGADRDGVEMRRLIRALGFEEQYILPSHKRRTTVKVRVIGNQQQVLRVDREDRFYLHDSERKAMLKALSQVIDQIDFIIIEDYDKGLLDKQVISDIIYLANKRGKFVGVDPKFRQFADYEGCTLFKPNLKELNEGLNLRVDKKDIAGIRDAVKQLRMLMPHPHTLVTLSDQGMLYVDDQLTSHHVQAHLRNIADVSGAGDTVISVASLAKAAGLTYLQAMFLANLAGGLVCEEIGVVPIDPQKLVSEAKKTWKRRN